MPISIVFNSISHQKNCFGENERGQGNIAVPSPRPFFLSLFAIAWVLCCSLSTQQAYITAKQFVGIRDYVSSDSRMTTFDSDPFYSPAREEEEEDT